MIAEQLQVNQSRTSWIARLYQPQAMAQPAVERIIGL
jgi:hypothetical protein